jgi:hypothetical protein
MGAFAAMHFFWAIFSMTEDRETKIYSNTFALLVGMAPAYLSFVNRSRISTGTKEENTICCGHYRHHHCWYPDDYFEPYPRRRRFSRYAREDDLGEREGERDFLERRLRRLENELAELRQGTSEKHD